MGNVRVASLTLAAAALLALGFTPWTMPRAKVQRALSHAFRAGGGTSLTLAGRTTFTILPLPHVSVQNLKLDYRDGAMRISAGEATIGLDAWSLLSWRVTPRNALFNQVEAQAPGGVDSPLDLIRTIIATGSANRVLPDLDWIAVRGGRVQLASRTPENGIIDAMNAMWTPGNERAPFDLSLSGQWRGEPLSLAITGPAGTAAGPTAKSAATFQLDTRLLSLSFKGNMLGGGDIKADGHIEASMPDAAALAAWLGAEQPLPGRLDQVKLSGNITASGQQFALADAHLTLNNDQYDGVIGLRLDSNRPSFSATLATDSADLTDQLQFLAPRRTPEGDWSQERYDTGAMEALDIDLRLSAQQLALSNVKLERAAVSLLLRGRRLELTLAEAMVAGGSAKGRLLVTQSAHGVDVRGQGTADQIDFSSPVAQGLGFSRISGRGSIGLNLEASGASTAALADTLEGRLAVSIANGELLGIDLDRFMLRLERRSLIAAALDMPTGRTPFDSAVLDIRAAAGRFEIKECTFRSRSLEISMTGQTSVPERLLDFSGILASNTQSSRAAQVPFTVRGTWNAPRFQPQTN